MDLLVIRHAIAMDQAEYARTSGGRSDDERPLTDEGRRKMRRSVHGIRALVPEIARLAASPLARAQETAQILAREYALEEVETVDALRPGTPPDALMDWLREVSEDPVAIVGHEPHLSSLVSWFIAGAFEPCIELKKGGACLIRFETQTRRGGGVLRWLVPPGTLRDLKP